MSANLVASLLLKLEDQLSGPLRGLTEMLDKARSAAAGINLSGLTRATDTVDGLNKNLGRTNEMLGRMKTMAREAGDAFATMGRVAAAGFAQSWEEAKKLPGRLHKFTDAGSGLVNAGIGAAAEGYAALEPAQAWAARDKLLRQQAMMEGLRGTALDKEIARLNAMVNADARDNAVSSDSVAEARKDLLGQGIPAALVDAALRTHTQAGKAYGIDPAVLGPVTAALVNNLQISPAEGALAGALAALAQASQSGRVKMEDFAHALPSLTGSARSLGMTGRGALNELGAAFEVSARTASDPTQAGYNLVDLLDYITSNRENTMMTGKKRKGGPHIDLKALLLDAEKHGVNPLDAFLGKIRELTKGLSPVGQSEMISSLVTNAQARKALLAIVQNWDEFQQRQNSAAGVGPAKLADDLATSLDGPDTAVKRLTENLHQLNLTIGQGFTPVLDGVNTGLGILNDKLQWLNGHFPKTTAVVLASLAVLLLLGAAVTIIGAVLPVFAAGWGLVAGIFMTLAPIATGLWRSFTYGAFVLEYFTGITVGVAAGILALAAALAAAAVDIYDNWDRFRGYFEAMWDGIKGVCRGAYDFLAGVFTGDMTRAEKGIEDAFGGLAKFFGGLFATITQLFDDFGAKIDQWTAGVAGRVAHGLYANLPAFMRDGFAEPGDAYNTNGTVKPGYQGSAIAGAAGANGQVNVHVSADPGLNARATSSSPGVNVTSGPNRGATVTRP